MKLVSVAKRSVLVCLITLAGARASTPATPAKADANPKIGLYVLNYAGVPDNIVRSAERQVSRIFRQAGINIDWVEGNNARYISRCAADFKELPCCLLRIQRRLTPDSFSRDVAGYAITGSPYATIVFDRIEQEAREIARTPSLVLGHTMAHEIGHIFLPVGYHSLEGIMQRRLDEKSWSKASQGMLLFSSEEAGLLRRNVLAHRPKDVLVDDQQPR